MTTVGELKSGAGAFDAWRTALRNSPALPPWAFYARKALREAASSWYLDTEGFPTLLGGRIRPLVHQIYAVRRVLGDREQRFLLADEVGLGKTIEAGMILQALWHHRPDMSVLVVAPGVMVMQWWRELYLRFGARAFHTVEWDDPAPGQLQRILEKGRLVVSVAALARSATLRTQLVTRRWDAIVIDEAHNIPAGHPIYDWLRGRSAEADHALILSATPSKRELSGLASLLGLVSPSDYDPHDVDGLERRITERQTVWEALDSITRLVDAAAGDAEALTAEEVEYVVSKWPQVLRSDERIGRWLSEALSLPGKEALNRLHSAVAFARERWSLDRKIIRTRRRTLEALNQRFPERRIEAILKYDYSAGEAEIARLLDEFRDKGSAEARTWWTILNRFACTTPALLNKLVQQRLAVLKDSRFEANPLFSNLWFSDPGPQEERALLTVAATSCPPLVDRIQESRLLQRIKKAIIAWEQQDGALPARMKAAIGWLQISAATDTRRKFLVFAQEPEVVQEFTNALLDLDLDTRCFHRDMDPEDREIAAFDFMEDESCRVLVCDELGGEGLNFQRAWAVVHLDIPLSPGRLEQRIGRADRLGRNVDEAVRSVIVSGPNQVEIVALRAHKDVFGVFERSIGGLEFVIPRLLKELRAVVHLGADDLETDLHRLADEVRDAIAEADDVFQSAMDTSQPRLHRAKQLADALSQPQAHVHRKAPLHWLKALGIDCDKQPEGRTRVKWTADRLEMPIPGLPNEGELVATWQRNDALRNNSVQFVAPGHPLVDGAFALLDSSEYGRAAFISRHLGPGCHGATFALATYVVELPAESSNTPAGLLARARAEFGFDVHVRAFRFDKTFQKWVSVTDADLIKRLEKPFIQGEGDRDLVDRGERMLPGDPEWQLLGLALDTATEEVQRESSEIAFDAAKQLMRAWSDELAYFEALLDGGTSDEKLTAASEKRMRLDLLQQIQLSIVRLDSLVVIRSA